MMVSARSLTALLAALVTLLALSAGAPQPSAPALRVRRQLADDDALQPIESGTTWQRPRRSVRPALTNTRSDTSRRARHSGLSPDLVVNSGEGGVLTRDTRQADDIPVFDRNKVSLDFPGSLFGPSVSLLIRTTKVIGDVVQNSAVRYQTFLRLFRPLFRGQFEIKGLDPVTTTTTTTTTTSTAAPSAADNEVRRRRNALH